MERLAFSIFILLSLPFSIPSIQCSTKLNTKQTDIMTNLSQTLDLMSSENTHWINTDKDPCHWYGVVCSSPPSPVITKLSFSNFGISSQNSTVLKHFFKLLCDIDTLQFLDLSNNNLPEVPDSFFSICSGLQDLIYLNISNTDMSGFLPNFSSFRNLEILDLSHNFLSGTNVSTHLYTLPKLKSLNLSYNLLSGTPPVIAARDLVLSRNRFTGAFPMEIFQQKNLSILDLSQNKLEGLIPNKFSQLPSLEVLLLNENNFTGNIPDSISNITNLTEFSANLNKFYGSIPMGLTDYLKKLDLSYNNLDGELPYNLLQFPNLEMIDLSGNLLEGPIPVNMSSSVQRLHLSHNSFNASIPASIGNLTKLVDLGLDNNLLEGSIPSEIGKCKNLISLNLGSNFLDGSLPKQLGDLLNLESLKINNNRLNNAIPTSISNLKRLVYLNLGHNSLIGEVPQGIFSLENLERLDLQDNSLHGSLPYTIKFMTELIELQLGKNLLNGSIPEMPINLAIALNLSRNFFTGTIHEDLGDLPYLGILDLSHNNLYGSIPSTIILDLSELTLLDISYNNLSGTIFYKPGNIYLSEMIVYKPGNVYLELASLPNTPPPPSLNPVDSSSNRDTHQLKMRDMIILVVSFVSGMVVSIVWCSVLRKWFNLKQEETVEDELLSDFEENRWMEAQSKALRNLRLFHFTQYLEQS